MSTSSPAPTEIVAALGLEPHPEGGWYRETWRADAPPGQRASATAIHFLLEAHQRSHWHRVDAAELWLWHAGSPLELSMANSDAGPVESAMLGGDVLAGQAPQLLVPPHWWQAARPQGGWALVSCVVSPAFEFSGFELVPDSWTPGLAIRGPASRR
jgi:predicted cupin superfamily sugar epimerase